MTTLTPYKFFTLARAFHLHFTSTYDIVKYNAKVNVTVSQFEARKDKQRYHFFAGRLKTVEKALEFVMAQFIYGVGSGFIFDTFDNCNEVYLKYLKIREALSKTFKDDLIRLKRAGYILDNVATSHPADMIGMLSRQEITYETLILLNNIYDYFPLWENIAKQDPLMGKVMFKLTKYAPFVTMPIDRVNSIIVDANQSV